MAVLIEGKTTCGICCKVIDRAADAIAFPAFLSRSHRLAKFSDAAFHAACFASCAERDEVESVFKRYQEIWESRPKELRTLAEIEAWGKEAFRDL